jgi:hypothetical protein
MMPDIQERRPSRLAMGADSTIGPSDLEANAAPREIRMSHARPGDWRSKPGTQTARGPMLDTRLAPSNDT